MIIKTSQGRSALGRKGERKLVKMKEENRSKKKERKKEIERRKLVKLKEENRSKKKERKKERNWKAGSNKKKKKSVMKREGLDAGPSC